MGSGIKKAGIVLLATGSFLTVAFFVIGLVFVGAEREHKILDEGDFSPTGYDTYRAWVSDDDTGSSVRVVIKSRIAGEQIDFDFIIEDDWGWEQFYDSYLTTPFDEEISLDPYAAGEWKFEIQFDNYGLDDHDIYDVDIAVYSTSMTSGEQALCCGLMIIPMIGLAMAITGLVMVIVGFTKKRKDQQQTFQPIPGTRPQGMGAPQQPPIRSQPGPAGPPRAGPNQQAPQRQPPVRQQANVPVGVQQPEHQQQGAVQPAGPDQVRMMTLKNARENEKRGNFSEAMMLYERMELFDDAERCIRRSKGLPPKDSDPVVVLKRIKARGTYANYTCQSCGAVNIINGSKLGKRFCDNCKAPIDFDMLAQL